MINVSAPANEVWRLQALHSLDIMDSEMEASFNEITEVAARVCGTEISLVSLLDESRQWFKARYHFSDRTTPRDIAFCSHTLLQDDCLEIQDAHHDIRFHDNPLVTGAPFIRFYAGVPLTTSEGLKLGTLCVIDSEPRKLTVTQHRTLKCLANQVMAQIELRRRNRNLSSLNDQNLKLLSIVGHDIKAPLNELSLLMSLYNNKGVTKDEFDDFSKRVKLSLDGTNVLVQNLLEWAQSQFQQTLIRPERFLLSPLVEELTTMKSLHLAKKENHLINAVPHDVVINANRRLLEFVLRNLISNANKFTTGGTIRISCHIENEKHIIDVADNGIGMEHSKVMTLFSWEKRSSTRGTFGEKGSGLGLQLCKDFIEKINGTMTIDSTPGKGTRVRVTLQDC